MGKAIRASALIVLLACTAQAGWMGNNSPTQAGWMGNDSPAQPTSTTQEPTTGGEMPNDATDTLPPVALDLLAALPSLL
jgi:hypothetical protein